MPPPPPSLGADTAQSLVPRENSLDELEHALETTLSDATPATKDELRRLARYRPPPAARHLEFPKNKLAAVLVLLHLNPLGELSVTLTTRSSRLRSHPGETALPGGRWEEGDGEGGVWTAYREAHEEIGLPLPPRDSVFASSSPRPQGARPPPSHLLHLTTLAPFTSRTLLVVLPVVALLVEPAATATSTYLPRVLVPSPDEVAALFHLPLRAFLLRPPSSSSATTSSPAPSTRPSTRSTPRTRPSPGTEALSHSFADFAWLLERPYRLHSFSSADEGVTPSAVTGLTADIVVRCAMVAESGRLGARGDEGEGDEHLREPGFEREAEGQLGWEETIRVALGLEGRLGLGERVKVGAGGGREGGRGEEGEERGEVQVEERRAGVLARA
ncbi:hypothetical protein JCM9279_006131 [Rhodotorula babjevae]